MPQTVLDFLNIATKIINYKYGGNPLSLATFQNKVELLTAATEQKNQPYLLKFVKSCLEGKALEALPAQVNSLQELLDALKSKIKLESSEVIEGKLMALKADHAKLNDYASKVEKLALAMKEHLFWKNIHRTKPTKWLLKKQSIFADPIAVQ